ncbi:flippase-like domain-containing protein [candidate division WOR-3 bacterium]|nr:flippase-like domain-containing protein [candidate division WOR-3 bacterium]
MKSAKYRQLLVIARVVVGVGLIVFLFRTLDISTLIGHIRTVELKYLAYAAIPYILFVILSAWRWQILLDFKRFTMPFNRTLRIYLISLFFNNFLPTTVGGDMMRVVYTMKDRRADSLATVLVDRILGFVGLFIFALFAVVYLLMVKNETEFLPFMVIGLVVVSLITFLFFSRRAYRVISPLICKVRIFGAGARIRRLHEAGNDFSNAWGTIIACIVLSILIQATLAIAPYLVLLGMGNTGVNLLPFFIYVPIINVISMIPVSLNGLGIRENFYVILFSRAGLSGELSLAISLLSFFVIFMLSLNGGVLFVFNKQR